MSLPPTRYPHLITVGDWLETLSPRKQRLFLLVQSFLTDELALRLFGFFKWQRREILRQRQRSRAECIEEISWDTKPENTPEEPPDG